MAVTYPSGASSIPLLGYFDPSEVFQVKFDFGSSANTEPLPTGVTIAQATWTTPTGLVIGDGSTVASAKAGNYVAIAPTLADSSRSAVAEFYVDDATAGDLKRDGSYQFRVSVTARLSSGGVVERSCYVRIKDR